MIEVVKIPEQRKGVLIGKGGSVKREIEKKTNTKITITDVVEIEGEPVDVLKAREIVKAIARGFSPEKAFKLLDDDYQLFIISLGDMTENSRKRIMSRIIGTNGKVRQRIEMATNTDISVYGKTVSFIGKWEDIQAATKAVEMIIEGKTHQTVFKYLATLKGAML